MKRLYDQLRDNENFSQVSGMHLPPKAVVLGEGTRGTAYGVGRKVVKITDDDTEADASSLIAGKKYKGIWNVYGVYEYKGGEYPLTDSPYIIVGERLKDEYDRAYRTVSLIDHLDLPQGTLDRKITNKDIKEATELIDSIKAITKLEKRDILSILEGLVSLSKLGIRWQDLHVGNLMINNKNEMVIIDLGYSKSPSKPIETFEWYGSS